MGGKDALSRYVVVSYGTLRPELRKVQEESFLDADSVLFTAPGLHERPRELEQQLVRQVAKGKERSQKVIAVYGAKCFVKTTDPTRDVDALVRERQIIAGGKKIYG